MPEGRLARFVLLPELKMTRMLRETPAQSRIECEKTAGIEYCPKCAQPSQSTYDHRVVRVLDAPLRDKTLYLWIRKRRLWCKACQRPFTEPVPGVKKGKRHTERYAR